MKEAQKEIKKHITIYEAIDGTEFKSKEECIKYEESAKCVLMAKYNKLVIKSDTMWNFFNVGSDEETVDIVKLNGIPDIDVILKLIALNSPVQAASHPEWLQEKEDILAKAIKEDSPVVIGRGYEGDCFYIYFTIFDLIEKLNSLR